MINQRELRNNSGEILQAAANGETFIVTRNGTPMAELRPLPKRTFVSKDELAEGLHLPPVDYKKLREDIDASVDQDPFHEH